MQKEDLIYILGLLIAVIGYFLKNTIANLEKTMEKTNNTVTKIEILEVQQTNLSGKFDELNDNIKELTREMKNLAIELSKKKQ